MSTRGSRKPSLDRFYRVVDQRWDKAGVGVDRDQYTYDRDSNRLTKTNALNSSLNENYSYDTLNQLTSVVRVDGFDQSWTLDALGNWTSFNNDGTVDNRTHNAHSRDELVLARTCRQRLDKPRARWGSVPPGPRAVGRTIGSHLGFSANFR